MEKSEPNATPSLSLYGSICRSFISSVIFLSIVIQCCRQVERVFAGTVLVGFGQSFVAASSCILARDDSTLIKRIEDTFHEQE